MQSGSRSAEPTQALSGVCAEREAPALRDEEKAAWAALLAQAMPRSAHPLPGADVNPPRALGHTPAVQSVAVGDMTQSQSSDTGGVNPDGLSRLTLSITSEALGRIDFVIDRRSGELSLWIAASDEARALISADQTGLARHLEGAHLPIKNLNIVGHGELGTVLAQRRMKRDAHAPPESTRTPDRPRKRRIDLIG